jgi:adenylate cyclase
VPASRSTLAVFPRVWLGASAAAWRHGLVIGAILAAIGGLLVSFPLFWPAQESIDLAILFKLRGTRAVPDDVVLVTIDPQTSERVSLPAELEARERCLDLRVGAVPSSHERLPPPHLVMRWPRCVHAYAVRALAAAGARVIALDISFRRLAPVGTNGAGRRKNDAQDQALADAIRQAGNVLLAQWLDPVGSKPAGAAPDAQMNPPQRPAPISPAIEWSALGAAPLRLTWGLAGRVNGFATFGEEDGPISSMPALIQHVAAAPVHSHFIRLLSRVVPEDADLLPRTPEELLEQRPLQATSLLIRHLIRSKPETARALRAALSGSEGADVPAQRRDALSALIALYAGDSVRYLNFYGPPGSFRSVSYADVLKAGSSGSDALASELRGKTVIVGYVDFTPSQRDDHYPTVYTTNDGVKLSGSEILATAVANLESDSTLRAPTTPLRAIATATFGLALGVLLLVPPPVRGLVAAVALCAIYLGGALLLFRFKAQWLPVLVPLQVQAPIAILYGVAYHYWDMRRKREQLRALFGKFVPGQVIDGLLDNRAKLDTVNEPIYGVCLATDAERFTALAESMHPAQLARFLNRYFEVVFPPITAKGGSIIDLVGDAVLAFWTGEDAGPTLHRKACSAALELMSAVDHFNAASPSARLPTRIGICGGEVTTMTMGAVNHFEFRPVGDTVVTSSRLQELNKLLGTRILATESMIRGLDTLLVRDVGVFQLRGKNVPTHVFELMGERAEAGGGVLQLSLEFALALDALRGGRRDHALARFRAIRERYPQDGPTAFYVQWLTGNPQWSGGPVPQG